MSELFANPYDTSVQGFYFSSYKEYETRSSQLINDCGYPVEEFEIEFIDGDLCQLFSACDITQCTLQKWFDEIEDLPEAEQTELFYRCDNLNQNTQEALDNLNSDGFIQQCSLSDYAYESVNESGVIDCLPETLQCYFNHEAYARDLEINGEVAEFTYDSTTYVASGF